MLNTTALHGRLVADPELKHTPNDIAVVSFSLAVNSGFGDKQKVSFIDCVAWRATAEFLAKYFTKGQELALTGALQTRSYTAKDGGKRKVTEVVAQSIDFCGPKAEKRAEPAASKAKKGTKAKAAAPTLPDYNADDDLPF